MKIYTKTGDRGETSLFSGERVSKNHILIEAYGTVDEANSMLGLALSMGLQSQVEQAVHLLQPLLFKLGADLATQPCERRKVTMTEADIAQVESAIDFASAQLPELRHFIMPGGTRGAACLHMARTIIRRAERAAVAASESLPVSRDAIIFLNRLSDYLFVLARWENVLASREETKWLPD